MTLDSRFNVAHHMVINVLALAVASILLLQVIIMPVNARSSDVRWTPQEFPISFWCGPPDNFTTIERYREIKAAGFTHVMPPCGGAATVERNRRILGLCAAVGLKAFIADGRMPLRITGEANAKERLDAIVKDYKGYVALEGYHIVDEPGAGAFPGLAEVVAYLRQIDPTHHAYINLLPNYANAQQLGTPTYEEHVRRYQEQVKPFVISYDHYHFLTNGDRPLFFENLAIMRKLALEYKTSFWNIVLLVQHGPYRHLTEGELRYEAMQTLVYGGKGLLWFTYWQPDDPSFVWHHAMINLNGSHDPHYEMARRINGEVRALGAELLKAESRLVFHSGTLPPGGTPRPTDAPIEVDGVSNLTIGLFNDYKDHTLALVTNADYSRATTATIKASTQKKRLWQLNPATRKWSRSREAKPLPNGTIAITLQLPAGGATLLRW